MIIFSANAALTPELTLDDCGPCYTCAKYNVSGGCANCVYDATKCTQAPDCAEGYFWNEALQKCVPESLGGLCDDVDCADPYVLNITTCTCECPETDLECKDGYTYSTEICGCVKDACDDGYYWASLRGCVKCPDYVEPTSVLNMCGVHSSNKGANGISDCYTESDSGLRNLQCRYSDETGSYEFTNDCYYNILSDLEIGGGKFEQINP